MRVLVVAVLHGFVHQLHQFGVHRVIRETLPQRLMALYSLASELMIVRWWCPRWAVCYVWKDYSTDWVTCVRVAVVQQIRRRGLSV